MSNKNIIIIEGFLWKNYNWQKSCFQKHSAYIVDWQHGDRETTIDIFTVWKPQTSDIIIK
jgi:hypothetical protein